MRTVRVIPKGETSAGGWRRRDRDGRHARHVTRGSTGAVRIDEQKSARIWKRENGRKKEIFGESRDEDNEQEIEMDGVEKNYFPHDLKRISSFSLPFKP